jgi:hypothetical protein
MIAKLVTQQEDITLRDLPSLALRPTTRGCERGGRVFPAGFVAGSGGAPAVPGLAARLIKSMRS